MVVPFFSRAIAKASRSFGVVNMQRMSWPDSNRNCLFDTVILVGFQMFHPSFFDQLDNPAWVKVNTEADAASILCKMFDRQSKPVDPMGQALASFTFRKIP